MKKGFDWWLHAYIKVAESKSGRRFGLLYFLKEGPGAHTSLKILACEEGKLQSSRSLLGLSLVLGFGLGLGLFLASHGISVAVILLREK